MITAGPLWSDLAGHEPTMPFLPTRGLGALTTSSAILTALALTDLPFVAQAHAWTAIPGGRRLAAASPALVVVEALAEARSGTEPLVVRRRILDGDTAVAEVRPGTPYVLELIVIGDDSERTLQVLAQVPAGAVPLRGARATTIERLDLDAWGSARVAIPFYLPGSAAAVLPAVHVLGADGVQVASLPEQPLRFAGQAAETPWYEREEPALLAHLAAVAPREPDMTALAPRLADAGLWRKVLAVLRARRWYDDTVWAPALRHGDAVAAGEWLRGSSTLREAAAGYLVSGLLAIDDLADGRLPVIEIAPLIVARAHPFAGERSLDPRLRAHRDPLLRYLVHRAQPDARARLALAGVLLLQDRIAEAAAQVAAIDPSTVTTAVQADWARAWLALAAGDPDTARRLAGASRTLPSARWLARFAALARQLDEIAGGEARVGAPARERQAASEPTLRLAREDAGLRVDASNLAACELRWTPIDLEALFTRAPFTATTDPERVALVAPSVSVPVALDAGRALVPIPAAWRARHAVVTAIGGGCEHALTVLADDLDVRPASASGLVRIRTRSTGAPLAAAYVKVYREVAGEAQFHKDGHSDRRGLFDYASLTDEAPAASRFALFVDGGEAGSTVTIVAAPTR